MPTYLSSTKHICSSVYRPGAIIKSLKAHCRRSRRRILYQKQKLIANCFKKANISSSNQQVAETDAEDPF